MRHKPRVDLYRVDPAIAFGHSQRRGYADLPHVARVHGVGGFVGTILIGLLATATVTGGPRGRQAPVVVVTVAAYSFGTTWLIAAVLIRTVRVDQDDEHGGFVLAVHGDTVYDLVVRPSAARRRRLSHREPPQPGRIGTTEPVTPG